MVDGHAEWHDESVRGTSVDLVKHRLPHPRYIRSHLPWDLLPIDILNEDGSVKPKVKENKNMGRILLQSSLYIIE